MLVKTNTSSVALHSQTPVSRIYLQWKPPSPIPVFATAKCTYLIHAYSYSYVCTFEQNLKHGANRMWLPVMVMEKMAG